MLRSCVCVCARACVRAWKVGWATNGFSVDDQVLRWARSQSFPRDLLPFSRPTCLLSVMVMFELNGPSSVAFFWKRIGVELRGGNNQLHGADSILGSQQFFSWPRNSLHFMELEGRLPCSQELATCTYPEPNPSSSPTLILYLEDPS
jgi:hypothetical protein